MCGDWRGGGRGRLHGAVIYIGDSQPDNRLLLKDNYGGGEGIQIEESVSGI